MSVGGYTLVQDGSKAPTIFLVVGKGDANHVIVVSVECLCTPLLPISLSSITLMSHVWTVLSSEADETTLRGCSLGENTAHLT